MQQATATEYQTQHNIEWPKGNHTNTANTVDTGVLPQHHHAGEYYHRGTSNTKSYEHEGYGHYNSGYYIYDEFGHDEYGSCGYEGYGDGYYDKYYHGRNYNCYADHHNYSYDDYYGYDGGYVFNHYTYERRDVKEDISKDDDITVITNNKDEEYFNTGNKERIEI